MADYAPNYTARYRVRYFDGINRHSVLFRGATLADVSIESYRDKLQDVLDAIGPLLVGGWTVEACEVADAASDVFLPAPFQVNNPAGLAGLPLDPKNAPNFISFNGRTAAGGRVRFSLFGLIYGQGNSSASGYRITPAEDPEIALTRSALLAHDGLRGPDGSTVFTWYPYANFGVHAYYQRKARG